MKWPAGQELPDKPLRELAEDKPVFPALPRPATLDQRLADLTSKDAKTGWGAAEELAKLGAPAIRDLVRLMDFGPLPASAREAAALGQMGKAAAVALPDLRRTAWRGGTTEDEGLLSCKALEAADLIEALHK